MKNSLIPSNEEARLNELMSYLILDTPNEAIFDSITQLAAKICDVPTSLITFISRDRQWFKSVHSVGEHVIGRGDIPREVAFCSHTILDQKLMEVTDATQDPRFNQNPLVLGEPQIRFYAGVPLKTKNGFNLGALCVVSDATKKLSEHQKDQLTHLANITISLLEMRKSDAQHQEDNWRAEEAKKIKELLLGNLSHELLTPLNAIVGYGQLLELDLEASSQTEQKELVSRILERSHYLLRLITSLLEMTGALSQQFEFRYQETHLRQAVNEVVLQFHKSLELKKISFSVDIPSELVTSIIDDYWFKKVIVSLMLTMIEISELESKMLLRLKLNSEKQLYLELEAQQCYIDLSELQYIFSGDTKTQSSFSQKNLAMSLNLQFVRQVIEAQGGSVGLIKLPNKGCAIYATIHCAGQ